MARYISLPTLALTQGSGRTAFQSALPAALLLRMADIAHLRRSTNGLVGYQRGALKSHVQTIAEYLRSDDVLFPHALVAAIEGAADFAPSPSAKNSLSSIHPGTLRLPLRRGALRLVDGQQRALALAAANAGDLPVPVVLFAPRDETDEREQFVRLNAGRSIPKGLLYELVPLLPDTLPPAYERMRTPSRLVEALNTLPGSPWRGLIRRTSIGAPPRVPPFVADTSLLKALDTSLNSPRGALFARVNPVFPHDISPFLPPLLNFWSAVRLVFADAWGLPPQQSRLMHSVGVRAMGRIFDRLVRGSGPPPTVDALVASLAPLRAVCAWTEGTWPGLGFAWNALQATESHIMILANHLGASLYRATS